MTTESPIVHQMNPVRFRYNRARIDDENKVLKQDCRLPRALVAAVCPLRRSSSLRSLQSSSIHPSKCSCSFTCAPRKPGPLPFVDTCSNWFYTGRTGFLTMFLSFVPTGCVANRLLFRHIPDGRPFAGIVNEYQQGAIVAAPLKPVMRTAIYLNQFAIPCASDGY